MLKEAFEAGKFGVTAEMAPPKGYDFSEQLEAAKLLNGKVHGVNVTDMQSASLKASSLGLCIARRNRWKHCQVLHHLPGRKPYSG